mmetsp:Transcript_78977/g.218587  ORF Transcript_78977/g.218587 Transcript_78977/m.218587 type:complete len:373 (+) Transcript_78977:106-1224(+)
MPSEDSSCLKLFGKGLKAMFVCINNVPYQRQDPRKERCFCYFQFRRDMKEDGCSFNGTASEWQLNSKGGFEVQIVKPMTECEPYVHDWQLAHPEPPWWAVLLHDIAELMEKHPGVTFVLTVLVLALLVLLILKCCGMMPWVREVKRNVSDTLAADFRECCGDCGESNYQAKASEEVPVLDAKPDAAGPRPRGADATARGAKPRAEAQARAPDPQASDAESEDGDWPVLRSLVGSVMSVVAPDEEEDEEFSDQQRRQLLSSQQGPPLSQLRLQAGSTQRATDSSHWYAPPYHNVHRTSEHGHHIVNAHPEVVSSTRAASPQLQSSRQQQRQPQQQQQQQHELERVPSIPFPNESRWDARKGQGKGIARHSWTA